MEFYYEVPFQVRYWRPGVGQGYGIAFHEFVIDIYDGQVFSTKEILASPLDPDDAIVERCEWAPLTGDWCRS